ncbi:alpha-1,4-N-acetyl-D-galactosaminyltransferase [Rubripirellula amarantea]|uniref:Alpha-1,4-N-acetyl-D-galactosaminyltransferase n=1 Tax=Rubripirellula amarantea TaxID=2527999 RepID=A0A5C5WXP6_9BACT|nr:glycosyltransferase family 4 protein [Rubripirellula amarantea]TWT55039.1 alpha-1,4-N-acetyl-D-galactosaminyltransferase [Rubripirellula amarantea]
MKIACLIHSLDGGGAERVMAGLASRLANRSHQVTLITLDDGTSDRHRVNKCVQRLALNVMGPSRGKLSGAWNVLHRVHRIRTELAKVSPDVLLSFCDRTNVLAGLAVGPVKSHGHIPTVLSERSDPTRQKLPKLWRWLRRRAYRSADLIVTQTDDAADFFREHGFRTPVQVIASAVDQPPFASDRKMAASNRRIIGVGRLAHEKGFDRLLDAFAILSPKYPDWTLRILGEGDRRPDLEKQIADYGLTDRVSLPGWVSPAWNELGEATIFVLPSRYEGFPSALMEAMAMGVPSVALAEQAGSKAIIRDRENGWLAGPTAEEIAKAIEETISNESQREVIARNGVDVLETFGWDVMVDAYERALRASIPS